jgi:hypothetical protein
MTNETTKALLMILLIGSLVAATYVPEVWESRPTLLIREAMTVVWSAIALPDRALQHVIPERLIHAVSTQAALHGKAA